MSTVAGERIVGIDIPLPPGERVRWQGAPSARSLAVHAFHIKKVAVYFTILALWRLLAMAYDGRQVQEVAGAAAWLLSLGLLAVGASWLLGVWSARTTIYAITDRRVVMRIGMVLQSVVNIPFRQIHRADWRGHADGTGDIVLAVPPGDSPPYFHLWPHAKPWQMNRPEPSLRCIPEAAHVASLLQEAATPMATQAPVPQERAMRTAKVLEES
jgi:hypothetical protein